MKLFSPAKLNLFFRVLKKRGDGYHDIASLFQTISWGDILEIELAGQTRLTSTDPTLPLDNTNLILKTFHLFLQKTGLSLDVSFHLEKKIPLEGGLGGGSSNAATTLWGLNELTHRPATLQNLIEWSSEIGSDVPFFFSQGSAYCTGRGEHIQSLSPLLKRSLWLAKPFYGLSTPCVYQNCEPSRLPLRDPHQILSDCLSGQSNYFNDLESSAFQLAPALAVFKQKLLELGFDQVVMTGSGTTFFCLGPVLSPQIEGVQFYPAYFINREVKTWYKTP